MQWLTRKSRFLSGATMAAVLVLTAACGTNNASSNSSHSSTGSSSGSKVNVPQTKGGAGTLISQQNTGDADWVQTLDPAVVTDSVSISDIWLTNANLVKFSWPSNKVLPDLASHWKVSKNHRVWWFYLRKNAKFANGDPVTAQDAAWSLTRALLPSTKSPVALLYLGEVVGAQALANGKAKTLAGVKALNAHTLQIKLQDPIAYFLGTLAYPTGDVLDKRVLAGKPAASYLTNTCHGNVGAGPFEFVCQNKGSGRGSFYPSGHSPYMLFKPNPNYFGPKPTIRIKAPFYADSETNWRVYQAGGVDETVVPTADLSKAQSMPGFQKKPALETDYITTNEVQAPFNNLNCRLAVAYAIDRVDITEKLLHGTEYPLYDVIPKGMPNGGQGYFDNPQANGVPYYNPTLAKKYLSKCPGKLNNINIYYQNTSQDIVHEYDAIRANLQAIGANITPQPLTFNAWLTKVTSPMNQTKTQIVENLWIDDYPDAQDWLQNLLGQGANDNIGLYSNAEYNKLMREGNVEANPQKRAQLYKQAQEIVLKDGGWIGVGGVYSIYVIKPRVHGVVVANGLVLARNNNWANVSVG